MKNEKAEEMNWKLIGQFIAKIVALFTLIRDTFVEQGVGLDLVGWMLGDGKGAFTKALKALGEQYLQSQRWRTVGENAIEVNLDAPLSLPLDDATVEWSKSSGNKKGWVKVERRGLHLLCIDGRAVVLHLEAGQKTGVIHGHDLHKVLEGKDSLHPNILDALFENAHLIPESWKQDEQGRIRHIYFWAVGFRDSEGNLYVRYLYGNNGQWRRNCRWISYEFDVQGPAAILA